MQFYNPHALITEVGELLRGHGLDAELADSALAQTGACMLLRGFGLMPGIDAVDAYTRAIEDGPWPDADDRRAARIAQGAS